MGFSKCIGWLIELDWKFFEKLNTTHHSVSPQRCNPWTICAALFHGKTYLKRVLCVPVRVRVSVCVQESQQTACCLPEWFFSTAHTQHEGLKEKKEYIASLIATIHDGWTYRAKQSQSQSECLQTMAASGCSQNCSLYNSISRAAHNWCAGVVLN